jgi:hypothetical protein
MNRPLKLVVFAIAAAISAAPLAYIPTADAQSRGPYGDRDRDGIPNRYDRRDDRGAWGDRDHDGIPNAFDNRNNNRGPWGDKDHDGVPNRYDRNDNNPWRH